MHELLVINLNGTMGSTGALERLRPSSHGRTNILTKRGMSIIFFYSLPEAVLVNELGGQNEVVEMTSAGIR